MVGVVGVVGVVLVWLVLTMPMAFRVSFSCCVLLLACSSCHVVHAYISGGGGGGDSSSGGGGGSISSLYAIMPGGGSRARAGASARARARARTDLKALSATPVDPPAEELRSAFKTMQRRHEEALQSPSKFKYLVYQSGGNDGYGNRMPGAATALALALATDRIYVVVWRDTYDASAKFHELFGTYENGLALDVDDPVNAPIKRYLAKCLPGGGGASSSFCTTHTRTDYKQLARKDWKREAATALVFRSDDYPYPLLFHNPNHHEQLLELFGGEPPLRRGHFPQLASLLFPPSDEVASETEEFFQTYPAFRGAKHVVGMHLRLTKPMPDGKDKGVKTPPPAAFYDAARVVAESLGYDPSETAFFLASDQPVAREVARAYFEGSRDLRLAIRESTTFGRDGDRSTRKGLLGAVVEMYILSRCDAVIGSYGSSFSAVASAWGDVRRYDVRPSGTYWYAAAAEPCWRFAWRGHADELREGGLGVPPDVAYHIKCHEGMSTFPGWQLQSDFKVAGLAKNAPRAGSSGGVRAQSVSGSSNLRGGSRASAGRGRLSA